MLWIPDSRYWIPVFFSRTLDSGFQSLVGFRIPKTLDSGFHKQKFPGFQNLDSLTWGNRKLRHVLQMQQIFQFLEKNKLKCWWYVLCSRDFFDIPSRLFQHYSKYMFSNQKKLLITEASKSVICMIKICNTHIITIEKNYLLGTLDIWGL